MLRGVLLAVLALASVGAASAPTRAAACPLPKVAGDESPLVSRDARFILFARREAGCPLRRSIWLADADGRLLRRVAKPAFGVAATWRSDGTISLSRPAGTTILTTRGDVVERVPVEFPFWSPDAHHAAYQTSATDTIFLWPGSGTVPGRGNYIASPQPWSPSGEFLTYIHSVGSKYALVVSRPDGSAARSLYTAPIVRGAAWSAYGDSLAFAATSPLREDATHLFVSRADSTDDLGDVTPSFSRIGSYAWSSDESWIAFTGYRGGRYSLYAIRPDGSALRRLATHVAAPRQQISWQGVRSVVFVGSTSECSRLGIFGARLTGGAHRLTNACR